MLLNNS